MLARTPNQGYFYTDGQPTDPGSFSFRPGDLKAWKNLTSNRITMTVRWGAVHTSLTKIDEKNTKLTSKTPMRDSLMCPQILR